MVWSFQLTFYLRLIAGIITKKGTNPQNICLLSTKPSRDWADIILIISILSVSLCMECWTRTFQLQTVKLLLNQILPEVLGEISRVVNSDTEELIPNEISSWNSSFWLQSHSVGQIQAATSFEFTISSAAVTQTLIEMGMECPWK